MIGIIIAVMVLMAIGLWIVIAGGSRKGEQGDRQYEKWCKEHTRTGVPKK